ncbi:MAG TPA: tRNA lysidine(34) synthetase TilS [Pyrinomonadaceae bacterium]|jgi:tRNA(Ile)-lysidine synthase
MLTARGRTADNRAQVDVVKKDDRVRNPRCSRFAERLFAEWRRLALPVERERVVVAVSGGADSVALLLALEELLAAGRLRLEATVAHLDHGLRAEAGRLDALWVEELGRSLGFPVALGRASVASVAEAGRDNLEQAARRARYEFLAATAAERQAHSVLVAHTLDDQAETVMLRLLRGSGAEGLSGMDGVRWLAEGQEVLLARPLLRWARRSDTESYCRERGREWRVDAMNTDERFARVRVRQSLLPLMQTFNGRVVEALARTAELLREDSAALEAAATELLSEASLDDRQAVSPLRIDVLKGAPPALSRRALRQWIGRGRGDLRRLEMTHLLAVEALLEGERGGRVAVLPGGSRVRRKLGRLYFHAKRVEKGDGGD